MALRQIHLDTNKIITVSRHEIQKRGTNIQLIAVKTTMQAKKWDFCASYCSSNKNFAPQSLFCFTFGLSTRPNAICTASYCPLDFCINNSPIKISSQNLINYMNSNQLAISDQRRCFEVFASAITGIGKIVMVDIWAQKLIFILIACLFWLGYLLFRLKENPENLKYWGFTKNNFKSSFLRLLPFALASIFLFVAYGIYKQTMIINWHIIPILMVYPIWGVIQQYLVVGLVAGNLKDQKRFNIPNIVIIIITAVLFSVVHYPSKMLIIGTFILAIIYTITYLTEKNLWVLGIYHGCLGCLYYYLVLSRDPFIEVFGKAIGALNY